MALTTQVDIVSAEAMIYSGKALRVAVPSKLGELGILPRHAPLLASLKPGTVRILKENNTEEGFFISGGFVEVQPYIVTVLADTVLRGEQMDEAAARTTMERVEKELKGKKLPHEEYARLRAELDLSAALLRTIDELRKSRKRQ